MEVGFGFPQGSYGWRRVFPTSREPTAEETQEREQLEARLEAIAVALDGSEDEALAAEATGIEQRLAAIENGLDAFTAEQLAIAGAVVWLDHQGTAVIDRGFVRREDEPAPEPKETAADAGDCYRHAALDVKAGTVIGACERRHRSTEFRAFLDRIERAVPQDLEVHLVLDNLKTHKTRLVHEGCSSAHSSTCISHQPARPGLT